MRSSNPTRVLSSSSQNSNNRFHLSCLYGATSQRSPSLKAGLLIVAVVIMTLWMLLTAAVLKQSTERPQATSNGATGPSQVISSNVGGFIRNVHTGAHRHPAKPIVAHSPGSSTCGLRRDCLSCLFPHSGVANRSQPLQLSPSDCFWCASSGKCASNHHEALSACDDVEDHVCPSILWTQTPQNHRVIHVGIRKGGPEALVQMHLALNHWGFKTTLDTRKSMKEKGGPVMPFFLEAYKDEFVKAPPLRWVKNYDDWHQSAEDGDVLIATETWACKPQRERYLPRGVRQFQWHLTVWPRRDRSQCTIAGHTHYVARDYMRQSVRSLMYPYISPHIIQLASSSASWRHKKKDLVLYDSDTHLKDADLDGEAGVAREKRLASGLSPQQLYELYQSAKAGIDLQLPGGERFIYEAALFDVCVIVDDELNGADREDFPIPDAFRVRPNDKAALNRAVDQCIRDYDQVIAGFAPLKQLVLKQRVTFLRQVRRYFSNSVHVATVACSQEDMNLLAVRFLLTTVIQIPFAVVEFFVPVGVDIPANVRDPLSENSMLAAVFVTEMTRDQVEHVCHRRTPSAVDDVERYSRYISQAVTSSGGGEALVPTTSAKRTLVTVWMPLTAVVMSDDFVHRIATQLALQRNSDVHQPPPTVLFRIDHSDSAAAQRLAATSAASHAEAAPGHFVLAFAYFTKDAAHVYQAYRNRQMRDSDSERAAGWLLSRTEPAFAAMRDSVQMDHVAELVSVLDHRGVMMWGGQQWFDESVLPFLCTHMLWRGLAQNAVMMCPSLT